MKSVKFYEDDKTELLIESGANLNFVDNQGKSALIYAVSLKYDAPIPTKRLVEAGADINLVDD
jgi:ankyrin repeat protein